MNNARPFDPAPIAASNAAVRAQMNEFQRATADRLFELAKHFGCSVAAVAAPARKGGPFTFGATRTDGSSSAIIELDRFGGARARVARRNGPLSTELGQALARAVRPYWPEPTGRMVDCPGSPHGPNDQSDYCMTCLPWGWGKVPEYKPFDLDEARAQRRDIRRSSLPCDEGALIDRIDALLASGELVELDARWAGKGHVTSGYVLRWNLEKLPTVG